MNELKATRGPWRVGTKVKTMVFASDGIDLVADCTAGEFTRDVEVANAALIAEEPAMYEEIKYHLEMTRLMPDGEQTADFKRMDALLKKARGEA